MRVNKLLNYKGSQYSSDGDDIKEVDSDLITLFTALQGRLRLGSGTSGSPGENLDGVWLKLLTSGTANFEQGYHHTLESQPLGYIVVTQDKAGSVYGEPQGLGINTVWTSGTAYFKSDAQEGNFLVFLLGRGGS